ncbi:MAG: SMK killer toxin resistance protein [Alyxoria varia]|nr:MAG: SMK killer toxin resistance protein [Alyxoria varia]
MSSFMEDLWGSVFTPGPTSSLLVATNVTFAALQAILFTLLVATYSVHFVVLSVLSCGLWYSINWFAKEVSVAQAAADAEEKDNRKERASNSRTSGETDTDGVVGDEMDTDEGEDTETEIEPRKPPRKTFAERTKQSPIPSDKPAATEDTAARQTGLEVNAEAATKRRSMGSSTGSLSTDSEWEKVEDER